GGVAAGAPARPGDGGLAGPARGGLEDRPGSLQPFAREAAARGAAIERRDAEGLQSVSPDLDPGIAASEVVDELAQLRGRIAGAVVARIAARVQRDQAISGREHRIEERAAIVVAGEPVPEARPRDHQVELEPVRPTRP